MNENEYCSTSQLKVIRPKWSLEATLATAGSVAMAYLFALQAIRIYMKNREPYKLKSTLFWYNLIQVVLSVFGFIVTLPVFIKYGFNTSGCLEEVKPQEWVDYFAFLIKLYAIFKHIDLLDTIFFALRKKDNQITFLHVYHHVTMVGWGWITSLYVFTDHHIAPGLLNTVVHIFMYSYYLIASLGPDYAKYIWWKKYLTKLQLVQFVAAVFYITYQQTMSGCPVSTFVFLYTTLNPIVYFILFLNYYCKSYRKVKEA